MSFLKRHAVLARQTVQKALADGVTDTAAGIAFYALFGLFPLLLAVVSIAGHALASAEAQARVVDFLRETFPASADLLASLLGDIIEARGRLGLVAVLGLLWSASAGFGAISRAINRTLGSDPRRSLLKARLRYLLMALGVSALLIAYVALTSAVELSTLDARWTDWLGLEETTVSGVHTRLAGMALVFLVFALLYKEAPTIEIRWRQVVPGAVLATLLTEVGKQLFLAYVDHVANLEDTFGSLSSFMVLLLWLYVSAIALLVGAEYNAVRMRVQAEES